MAGAADGEVTNAPTSKNRVLVLVAVSEELMLQNNKPFSALKITLASGHSGAR